MDMKIFIVLSLLAGLLLVSLTLNYIFYKKVSSLVVLLYASKLDPMGQNVYPETTLTTTSADKNVSSKPKVMFYGDSRALSWTNPVLDHYDFINRAIGGQTSIQIAARFQAHVATHQPDIIILQLCVNDLKMIPLFPERKDDIIENCKKNIQKIIQQAHEMKTPVILSTVFPLADIAIDHKIFGMREKPIIEGIDAVNLFIKSLASDKTHIFDAYALLKSEESRKIEERYSRDWLHLNERGYEILNKKIVALLSVSICC